MRWLWILLPLFLLTACSDDAPQDTPPPSKEDETGASDDLCADGACDLADSRSKHGSRLQVLHRDWIGEDGSVIEQPPLIFDTKYGVECTVKEGFDGTWRCYPAYKEFQYQNGPFADANCTQRIIYSDAFDLSACGPQIEFYALKPGDNRYTCNFESEIWDYKFYHLPDGPEVLTLERPQRLYQEDQSGCSDIGPLGGTSQWVIFPPELEQYRVSEDDFVRMER